MQVEVHNHQSSSKPTIVVVSIFVALFLVYGGAGLLKHDRVMALAGGGIAVFLAVTVLAQAWYESRNLR